MRRRVLACALLVVLAGCLGGIGLDPRGGATPETSTRDRADAQPSATPSGDGVEAEVVDVVDGDTVKVVFPNGSRDTARLLGVDTPEVYGENSPGEFEGVPDTEVGAACLDRWAERASRYTEERLLGDTVTLTFDDNEPRRGYYGRLLVYVHDDEGEFNYGLVRQGLARVYDSNFEHRERYDAAESAAMGSKSGLWACREGGAGSTPEPSPTSAVADGGVSLRVAEVHADAEGHDGENLNDEYVVFRNSGDEPLDLSGWTVSDEAGHRFTFPDGTTLAANATLTLHTGSGTDTERDVYWGSNTPVWNNDGDTVVVRTAAGDVVLQRSYDG